jgi:hypothetical protein
MAGRAGERREGGVGCHEPACAKRREFSDRHAIARHDECLAAIERAHHFAAAVAQFALRDLTSDGAVVARVLRKSWADLR